MAKRKEKAGKKGLGLLAKLLCLCGLGALVYAHRRVIEALIHGEPLPEAPRWHFWCRSE